jgi:hypothetical protein
MESPRAMILTIDCRLTRSTDSAVVTVQIAASAVRPDIRCMVRLLEICDPG